MKEFTPEMFEELHRAHNAVRGTQDYTKYLMQMDSKRTGRWKFCMHTIPYMTGEIKTVRGKTYIVTTDFWDGTPQRFEVTEAVRELLGI